MYKSSLLLVVALFLTSCAMTDKQAQYAYKAQSDSVKYQAKAQAKIEASKKPVLKFECQPSCSFSSFEYSPDGTTQQVISVPTVSNNTDLTKEVVKGITNVAPIAFGAWVGTKVVNGMTELGKATGVNYNNSTVDNSSQANDSSLSNSYNQNNPIDSSTHDNPIDSSTHDNPVDNSNQGNPVDNSNQGNPVDNSNQPNPTTLTNFGG